MTLPNSRTPTLRWYTVVAVRQQYYNEYITATLLLGIGLSVAIIVFAALVYALFRTKLCRRCLKRENTKLVAEIHRSVDKATQEEYGGGGGGGNGGGGMGPAARIGFAVPVAPGGNGGGGDGGMESEAGGGGNAEAAAFRALFLAEQNMDSGLGSSVGGGSGSGSGSASDGGASSVRTTAASTAAAAAAVAAVSSAAASAAKVEAEAATEAAEAAAAERVARFEEDRARKGRQTRQQRQISKKVEGLSAFVVVVVCVLLVAVLIVWSSLTKARIDELVTSQLRLISAYVEEEVSIFLSIPIGMNQFQALVFSVNSEGFGNRSSGSGGGSGGGTSITELNFNLTTMSDPTTELARSAAIDAFNCEVHTAAALPTYLTYMATAQNIFLACGGQEMIESSSIGCNGGTANNGDGKATSDDDAAGQSLFPNCTNASSAVMDQTPSVCLPSGDCMLTPSRAYWGWNMSINGAAPATAARTFDSNGTMVPVFQSFGYRAYERPWFSITAADATAWDDSITTWSNVYTFATGEDTLGLTKVNRLATAENEYVFAVDVTLSEITMIMARIKQQLPVLVAFLVEPSGLLVGTTNGDAVIDSCELGGSASLSRVAANASTDKEVRLLCFACD